MKRTYESNTQLVTRSMLSFLLYKFSQGEGCLSCIMFFCILGEWTKTRLQIRKATSGQRRLLFTRRPIKGPPGTNSSCRDR